MDLHRYWFEFNSSARLPLGVAHGCGVTAHDYAGARELVSSKVFDQQDMPEPARVIVDVDVSTLDPAHVIPNMGNVLMRGIWFPLGYE